MTCKLRAFLSLWLAMDFLFFLLPSEESPEGLWRRTGDRFAGCVLRVEKLDSELVGRLVILPEAMARAGWVEGDLKWRNLKRNSTVGKPSTPISTTAIYGCIPNSTISKNALLANE